MMKHVKGQDMYKQKLVAIPSPSKINDSCAKWLDTIHSKGVQCKERSAGKKQMLSEIVTSPRHGWYLVYIVLLKIFIAMLLLWKLVIYLDTTLFHEKIEVAYRNTIKRIQINKKLTEGIETNTLCKIRERGSRCRHTGERSLHGD